MAKNNIGIIGMGRMGRCLVSGLLEGSASDKSHLSFTTRHEETSSAAEKDLGLKRAKSNKDLVDWADVIVLAVKPQNVFEVLGELGKCKVTGKTFVSIIASVTTSDIEGALPKGAAVVRAMPNTPCFVGAGITALCLGKNASEKDWDKAKDLFSPLGEWVRVDEKHMDAVTGLSGCGPAYAYVILESLTDGGIKVGLPRDLSTKLAAHTLLGAAKMLLETGRHPAALKDEVTTPAGCTIDGLMELEEGKLRVTLIKAVVQASERAKTLGTKTR